MPDEQDTQLQDQVRRISGGLLDPSTVQAWLGLGSSGTASGAYHGDPAAAPGDFPRMFRQGRLRPSPYNTSADWPGGNSFFIEQKPGR
jgi:hypothetical protein